MRLTAGLGGVGGALGVVGGRISLSKRLLQQVEFGGELEVVVSLIFIEFFPTKLCGDDMLLAT